MKVLTDFGFVINKRVGIFSFSFNEKYSFTSFSGTKPVHLFSNTEVTLFHQYLALFSIPVQCQVLHYFNVPISATMLKSLIFKNVQLRQLHVFDCNIPVVIDSLREVFQKCKKLVIFEYSDDYFGLMTADHLLSLFSQPTSLQVIIFCCNPNITSSSLELMVQNSPRLTELYLKNTRGLDLTTLREHMKNVKSSVKFTTNS
jgi:hypothetical protein